MFKVSFLSTLAALIPILCGELIQSCSTELELTYYFNYEIQIHTGFGFWRPHSASMNVIFYDEHNLHNVSMNLPSLKPRFAYRFRVRSTPFPVTAIREITLQYLPPSDCNTLTMDRVIISTVRPRLSRRFCFNNQKFSGSKPSYSCLKC